jgi:hypothetical protein
MSADVVHTPMPSIGDSSMPKNSASYPSNRPSTSGRVQRNRCCAPPCEEDDIGEAEVGVAVRARLS